KLVLSISLQTCNSWPETLTEIPHMLRRLFLGRSFSGWVVFAAAGWFVAPALDNSIFAQTTTQQPVVVTAPGTPGAYEEVPSAYGAPPEFSRSRFSNVVNAYVLPPWAFFFGELFEGQGFRHGPPDYLFTQEIEMGLPYRFNIAAESQWERFNGG